MFLKTLPLMCLAAAWLPAADKYSGPVPPKPDIPYLVHASNLIETETGQARQETKKNDASFVISGSASPARTPLAEPIFIMDSRNLAPDRLELVRLEVKGGSREVSFSQGRRRGGNKVLHLAVTPLSGHLYRIEADEPLENGEYALSPNGDNRVFCFQVY
jgi:hypothetical protein